MINSCWQYIRPSTYDTCTCVKPTLFQVLNVKMFSRIVNRTLLSAIHSKRTHSKAAAMDMVALQRIKTVYRRCAEFLTCISNIESQCFERIRATMPLARWSPWSEEARKTRPNLPHKHRAFFQRDCHQSASIWRKATGGNALLVPFQNIQPRGGLQVIHHYSAFTSADS